MNEVLSVFVNNILPIFLVAGMGFMLRRVAGVEIRPLSRMVFYVLAPCLIFSSLITTGLDVEQLGGLALFALGLIVVMGAIGWGVGWALGFKRDGIIVIILAAMFSNCGNYGLPLNELRYGAAGVDAAIPYFVVSATLMYTVGIFVASFGSTGTQSWRSALWGVVKLPIFYAVVATLFIYATGFVVPKPLVDGVTLAGRGAIPTLLIILGMQIAEIKKVEEVKVAIPAVLIRLILAPVAAALLVYVLGIEGIGRSASMLQASLPIAVSVIVIATEFDTMPKGMTTAVAISTLLSPITLGLLIQLMSL